MIRKLIDKFLTREIITYLIAGVLTTLLDIACSYIMFNIMGIDENVTTIVAWIIAVIFAYFINNYWVFRDNTGSTIKESVKFIKFFVARLFTLVVEEGGVFLFITKLGFAFWLVKLPLLVVVTILNYIFSKMMIFLKNTDNGKENETQGDN